MTDFPLVPSLRGRVLALALAAVGLGALLPASASAGDLRIDHFDGKVNVFGDGDPSQTFLIRYNGRRDGAQTVSTSYDSEVDAHLFRITTSAPEIDLTETRQRCQHPGGRLNEAECQIDLAVPYSDSRRQTFLDVYLSQADDTYTSNVSFNTLIQSLGGNDDIRIRAAQPQDSWLSRIQVWGGSGNDVINLTGSGVSGALMGDGGLEGTDGDDVLLGGYQPDEINGLGGNDILAGTGQATVDTDHDRISGDDGDDIFLAGPDTGNDVYDGGPGTDTVDYGGDEWRTPSVNVSLDGIANDGHQPASPSGITERDNVLDVESVKGAEGDDVLTGSENAERLDGAGGNDTILATRGGDTVVGGPGNDTIDFGAWAFPVRASLDGLNNDGIGDAPGRPTLFNANLDPSIETILGGSGRDSLKGSAGPNTILGGAGADTIDGLAGSDTLRGGGDVDQILSTDASTDNVDCEAEGGYAVIDAKDTAKNCKTSVGGLLAPVINEAAVLVGPRRLTLPFTCPDIAACSGTITVTLGQPKANAKTGKGKTKARSITLAKSGFNVAAGASASPSIALTKSGRANLKAGASVKATATIVSGQGAQKTTTTQPLALSRPK